MIVVSWLFASRVYDGEQKQGQIGYPAKEKIRELEKEPPFSRVLRNEECADRRAALEGGTCWAQAQRYIGLENS